MNVISKISNTLTKIIGTIAASFKVGFDIAAKGSVRDMEFVTSYQFGDDCVEVWVSDLLLQRHGADVDQPNAICTLPQVVKNGANRYYIYVSRSALADPYTLAALVAHECGHVLRKHLYNAAITNSKRGVVVDADYEIEADRFACILGMSDAMRKIIISAKETSLRGWTNRKYIEIYDARLKAIDDWEAAHK